MVKQPFKIGQYVVSLSNFKGVRKTWGYNYPHKGEIVRVLNVIYRAKDKMWFIMVPGCECQLYYKNFAPVEDIKERFTDFVEVGFSEIKKVMPKHSCS